MLLWLADEAPQPVPWVELQKATPFVAIAMDNMKVGKVIHVFVNKLDCSELNKQHEHCDMFRYILFSEHKDVSAFCCRT